MGSNKYLKYIIPLLILFFIFCLFIIPNFIPALMPKRNQILMFGSIFFLIIGDLVNMLNDK